MRVYVGALALCAEPYARSYKDTIDYETTPVPRGSTYYRGHEVKHMTQKIYSRNT